MSDVSDHFVEVWHGKTRLDNCPSEASLNKNDWSLLSADEKNKAMSFLTEKRQKKYIKIRVALKKILASYLNIEAKNIVIKTGEFGKPLLEGELLYFNLSHTGNRFIVVVSNLVDVGIDLELKKERKNQTALVDKCFSATERWYWHALSEEHKTRMFYRFWVRKEAFVKAVGRGIALGLNQCVVNPLKQDCFLSIPATYGLTSDWKIIDIPLAQEILCAVVIKGMKFEYKLIEFQQTEFPIPRLNRF